MTVSRIRRISFLLVLVLIVTLSACNSDTPQPIPSAPPEQPQAITETLATETATLAPPTATQVVERVILLTPIGSDSELRDSLKDLLQELGQAAGLSLEVRDSLTVADIDPGVRIVLALPPTENLEELAQAAPEVQFLAVGGEGLEPAKNLSVISGGDPASADPAFLAGAIAASLTPDWRVGVLYPAGAGGEEVRQGFINGVYYFCGLCRPSFPPFYEYPISAEAPGGDGTGGAQSAADFLIDHAVSTVYVAEGVGDDQLFEYLAEADIQIIGSGEPPAGARSHWIASIHEDLNGAVRQVWPELIQGKGGLEQNTPLVLDARNESNFSPGKQHLAEDLLEKLQAGYIDPGTNSLTATLGPG